MRILTKRHFYSQDPSTNIGSELLGSDYQEYERVLTANNDDNHLCDASTGLTVTKVATSDSTFVYKNPSGQIVTNIVGLFDFFKPLLTQDVAILTLLRQNVATEDSVINPVTTDPLEL